MEIQPWSLVRERRVTSAGPGLVERLGSVKALRIFIDAEADIKSSLGRAVELGWNGEDGDLGL